MSTAAAEILAELRAHANPDNVAGMARYGISTNGTLGITIPVLTRIAKRHRRDHDLALALWASGIHEARILAAMIDDPARVAPAQMDAWVADFDSWDVCDQVTRRLFARTPHAWERAAAWCRDPREFVRRAGFATIVGLTMEHKKAPDSRFEAFFPLIREAASDDRNFVRKAVSWALRQIGKRNLALNGSARALADELQHADSKAARWIGRDALRELAAERTLERVRSRSSRPGQV